MADEIGVINPQLGDREAADQHEHQSRKSSKTKYTSEQDNKQHRNELEEEYYSDCGWGPWKPRWAQFFNNPKGYLFLLSFHGFMQGMVAFGFLYMVITTLEKRFNLSSVNTGLMASCYEIAEMSVVIFVTYLGERGNKPVWIGCCGMMFATGAIVFSLPHFLTGLYDYQVIEFATCDTNRTISNECDPSVDNSSLSNYLYVFMAGNILMGIGGSPLYTLGVTYMDENVRSGDIGVYMGIFNAACALGPAIGFLVGGLLLNVHTDIHVDKNELTISPESPVWVGAWWLGFVVGGLIVLTTSMAFLGFPSKTLRSTQIAKCRKSDEQSETDEGNARQGIIDNLRRLPIMLCKIIRNVSFMIVTGAVITEWFILSGLSVFTPKYLESQFNMTVVTASYYTGIITLISGVVGSMLGGWAIKQFKLNCLGQLKLCLILISISFVLISCFIMYCTNILMAGVTVHYNSSQPIGRGESNITAACNVACNCETAIDPVCGANNVLYYTACHAGCQEEIESEGTTIYRNCSCVMASGFPIGNDTIHAKPGRCEQRCQLQWVFIPLVLCLMTMMFAAVVPAWTATMRCVSYSQRAFGLGIQTLLYGLLGTVPGPIVYGTFIDTTCLIWEYHCDGSATCWLYDNKQFAHSFLLITITMKILSILFFSGSIVFYKPIQELNDYSNG